MFKTKLEVDRHVEQSLKRINNETERNLRCFAFAKLYFNVGDYEQACRYVSSYLSVKPKSPEGHALLGKTLEKLGKKEAALEAYRTSLQQDPKQHNLVIKVCELLASDDVDLEQSGAKYFCDLAQSLDPHNPVVFSLKERLITNISKDPNEVTQLLLKELEWRPTDVNLRVRLLKHFLQNNMITEAYKHASDIEEKSLSIFQRSLPWYEVFAEVLVRYQRHASLTNSLNWEFWFLSVSVLERLVALSLDEHIDNVKPSSDYLTSAFNFDQMFSKACQNINACPDRTLVQVFTTHYQAQLYFHFATLIFKQAKRDLMQFKEAVNVTLPVLLVAYHCAPVDLQSMWFSNAPENRRKLVVHWHKDAAFRCSQAGHVLLAAAKDRKSIILEKATQYSTGMWREHLFKKVFVTRDQQLKINTSYFVSSTLEPVIRLPDPLELIKYDDTAQSVYPDSLHHYVWIALNNNLTDFTLKSFEGLQYTVRNLNNCAAETLNVLDVQAFIYCATLCAKSKLDDTKHLIYYNQDRPSVLPASITETLGTLNQSKFLTAAYKMYKNEQTSNFGEVRLLLIKGIEVVRCVGHHGLDVKVLVNLANIFAERANKSTKQSEIEANAARADLYWKTALPLLEKIKNNQLVTYPASRLFEYRSKEMSINEATGHIEKGKLFSAVQLMKNKDYEKALHIFEGLKDPYASFYQSQIYKHMADQKTNQNKENVTSEMRSQNIILLSRARDCLYLTLDRLREPSVDRDHPLNAQLGTEIEKIERLLSRIDPDCNNRNECDGMSDENVSSDNSIGDHYVTTYTTHASFHNGQHLTPKHEAHNHHSTPMRYGVMRQEARPSPERLDAQLRQLAASKDIAINSVLEQNKIMVDSHRSLIDELKSFKDAVNNLTATVDEQGRTFKSCFQEISGVKKSVDKMTDDLQNVTDVVQEMKKEIKEIKKDQQQGKSTQQHQQLSEEDLYVLDPEFNAMDYNINANLSQMYPHYAGTPAAPRLPNPNLNPYAAPPALYPGLYPGIAAAYAYGGLGLPPQPFLTPEQQISNVLGSLSPYGQPPLGAPNLTRGAAFTGQSLSQQSPKESFVVPTQTTPAVAPSVPVATNTSSINVVSSRAAPVNVVITASDPLPTNKLTTTQPILSVTIPPQHIKGNKNATAVVTSQQTPHNYQIPLPVASGTFTSTPPSVLSQPPPIVSTQSILSSVAPPQFSAVAQNKNSPKNVSLGLQIERTLDQTFNNDSNVSKSNISSSSIEEYDARPDFKPIVPLPDEVPVNTGEENETELFCQRAKLYRHVNNNGVKEWKERGVGNLKILQNTETGKVRLLMRRDQVHKVCANHFLTPDMVLTLMANNDRAYIWAAHDFADEEMVVEKFCVRFKTSDEAKKFHDAFEDAKKKIGARGNSVDVAKVASPAKVETPTSNVSTSLGGFVFTSTPTFKIKEAEQISTVAPASAVKDTVKSASPFAGFTFGGKPSISTAPSATTFSPTVISQNTSKTVVESQKKETHDDSGHAEEFEPTAEFKPVVDLPELVDVKTGEEDSEVLFEERAKLFRYDTSGPAKEWKERGVGIMKVLKDDTIRLVMRRDQIHKICCNHQVLKNMAFKQNPANAKTVVWQAQDFSEGVLKAETFTIRFKTEDQAVNFLKTIQHAQINMDESNQISSGSKHHKADTPVKNTSFGDKFKLAKGSWECKNCYVANDGKSNHCVACETPKSGNVAKKADEAGPKFSFGVQTAKAATAPVAAKMPPFTWGNAFKPAEKSWECQACLVRNSEEKTRCISCDTLRDGVTEDGKKVEEAKPGLKGIDLDTGGQKFTFGIPAKSDSATNAIFGAAGDAAKGGIGAGKTVVASSQVNTVASGFGDVFKPKQGTWECKVCYIRNEPISQYCLSCETPKDDSVPSKNDANATNKGINLDTPGQKFSFGIPSATGNTNSGVGGFSFGRSQLSFGNTAANNEPTTEPPSSGLFKSAASTDLFKGGTGFNFGPDPSAEQTTKDAESDKFVFGSPQKHDFEFKPRSPRRISSGQGEESDGYAEEEEDNIYFKPVVPLPDKVDVKTGEEGEEVLYCHRAKLFRFTNGEWKERGIGDIKILKQKDTGKLRVVMRREQVLKICLNHVLTADTEYLEKDEKTWLFHAADFSEGEISRDQFCIRFKTADIAKEFKTAVAQAVDGKPSAPKLETEDSEDDVQFVSETKVTPEEEAAAIKLGLPPKFMSYKQLPDCTCDQCQKDDEYLKELFTSNEKKPVVKTSSTSSTNLFAVKTPSTGDSVFCTPNGQIFGYSFGTTTESSLSTQGSKESPALKELLQKPSENVKVIPSATFSFTASADAVYRGFPSNDPLCITPTNLFDAPPSSAGILGTPTSRASIFAPETSEGNISTPKLFGSGTSPSIFGQAKTQTGLTSVFPAGSGADATSPFGPPKGSNTFTSGGSIFGSSGTVFGAKPDTPGSTATNISSNISSGGSIFGSSGTVFGAQSGTPSSTATSGGSIFGSSGTVFGAKPATPSSTATNISSNKSLFGADSITAPTTKPSVFGTASATMTGPTTKPSIFGTTSTAPTTKPNIFGTASATGVSSPGANIFGAKPSATPVFGGTNIFGSKAEIKPVEATMVFGGSTASPAKGATENLTENDDVVLKCDTGLSFEALASKTAPDALPAFVAGSDTAKTTPFSFLGAGAPVFGGKKTTANDKKNESKDGAESDENDDQPGGDNEHDPHFEPVVPLPDAVVVTTGEEEETQLFNERAKLYRFDANTKEWKERGVGQMKILYHPENGTYRLLLRREQVHKVVLNQRVMSDLDIQPMTTSDKAWMWAGYNYTDDENNLEKLAVRFKTVELAAKFKQSADAAIAKVVEAQNERSLNELPATVLNYGLEDVSSADDYTQEAQDGEYVDDEEEEDEDDEEDDEDDDEEKTLMFTKRCTLSEQTPNGDWKTVTMGDLQVYYDPDFYAAKITVKDDNGTLFSNTLIGMNTLMDIEKNECRWRAVEWGMGEMKWKNLKATFSSESAAQEFHSNYLEGVNYAQEVGLIDELPTGEGDTE